MLTRKLVKSGAWLFIYTWMHVVEIIWVVVVDDCAVLLHIPDPDQSLYVALTQTSQTYIVHTRKAHVSRYGYLDQNNPYPVYKDIIRTLSHMAGILWYTGTESSEIPKWKKPKVNHNDSWDKEAFDLPIIRWHNIHMNSAVYWTSALGCFCVCTSLLRDKVGVASQGTQIVLL